MEKENKFSLAMNDMGTPSEMSNSKDFSTKESSKPIVEVDKPFETKDPIEIRDRASVTDI